MRAAVPLLSTHHIGRCARPRPAERPTRPSTRGMKLIDASTIEVSHRRDTRRISTMRTPEHHPTPHVVHGSDEGPPPPGPHDLRVRHAMFGEERVQVAGDLLAELERRARTDC